jgi:prepilin-type N-terminal cleavage/methylation domain-containing protein
VRAARPGFTLVELVIALLLLTTGLLALSASATVVAYELRAGRRAERAATVAASRLEALRASTCRGSAGVEDAGGLSVSWTVTPRGSRATATVTVSYMERGALRSHRFVGGFPCAPLGQDA